MSMLTGQYPSSHYAYSIGVSVDPFPTRTLPTFLRSAGYHSKLIGKSHFVSRIEEAQHMAGDQEPNPEFFRHWRGPYAGFDEIAGSTGHNIHVEPDMHYRVFLEAKLLVLRSNGSPDELIEISRRTTAPQITIR